MSNTQTHTARAAKARADLTAVGGWDNSMVSVSAGGVRGIIQDYERCADEHADLLAALIELRDNGKEDGLDMWDRVYAAIEKATDQQPN